MKFVENLIAKWKPIVAGLILTVFSVGIGYAIPNFQSDEIKLLKPIVEKPKQAEVVEVNEPVSGETCQNVTEYILKTDDILSQKNVIVLDLNTFELFKTKEFKEEIGYYYRQKGATWRYFTEFKKKEAGK